MNSSEKLIEREMDIDDVMWFIELCESNNIEVYIDGGWGVDALLGEQTRKHNDLDIALPHHFVELLKELLEQEGYKILENEVTRECNFVMRDTLGHEIDFHTYTFDEHGNNIYGIEYAPEHLTGIGVLNGREVKTINPEWMVKFHTGYELDEDDYHDVKLLCNKFELIIPDEYKKFKKNIVRDVNLIMSDAIPRVAYETGHKNPDILKNWQERSEKGGLVMFAIRDQDRFIASTTLLLDGADEQIVKDEIGIIPMINGLGVNEEFRNQGLGSILMDVCEGYVQSHPKLLQKIILGVEEDNNIAQKMYEERGYKYIKVAGKDTYDASWPEIGEDGLRTIYHTKCYLMMKEL